MPGSGKFQRVVEASAREEKRRKTVGYVVTAVAILALAWACWWAITTAGLRRFRGIEKFRGEIPDSPAVVRLA